MTLVMIDHACGHKQEKDLKNTNGNDPGPKSLQKSLAFWGARECMDCFKGKRAAETKDILYGFGELPTLQGSEKQIAWAEKEREKSLFLIAQYVDSLGFGTDIEGTDFIETAKEELRGRLSLLARVEQSKFWIDCRMDYKAHKASMSADADLTHKPYAACDPNPIQYNHPMPTSDGGVSARVLLGLGAVREVEIKFDLEKGSVTGFYRKAPVAISYTNMNGIDRTKFVGGTKVHNWNLTLG